MHPYADRSKAGPSSLKPDGLSAPDWKRPFKANSDPFLSKLSTTPEKSEKDQLFPGIDPRKHGYGHNWKHMEVEGLYADHALFLFVHSP